jgi:protein tyrosine phosphatase
MAAPLAFYDTEKEFEIIPRLFLGNYSCVKNTKADIIVNCTKDLPFPKTMGRSESLDKICIRLPVDDNGDPKEFFTFVKEAPIVIEKIHEYLMKDKNVLVHCLAGQQRSCAVVALYLMYKKKMSIQEAVLYIQERKKDAFFYNVNFLPALLELDPNI